MVNTEKHHEKIHISNSAITFTYEADLLNEFEKSVSKSNNLIVQCWPLKPPYFLGKYISLCKHCQFLQFCDFMGSSMIIG